MRVTYTNGSEEIMYARNGQFTMTRDGFIVDAYGNHLQGSSGDLQIPLDTAEVAIKNTGAVFADGVLIDRIALVDFEDYDYLELYGENMFRPVDGATQTASSATMLQGFTEQSNANVIDQMVSMITITRAYEAGQKMIQTQDNLIGKAVNEVGKL